MPIGLQLNKGTKGEVTATTLLERLDLERLDISNRLEADPKRRSELGQFLTPANVARFMAGMLEVPRPLQLRLLDAGGGSGILTAAAVIALCSRPRATRPKALQATIWEIDERFSADLARALKYCREVCETAGVHFSGTLHHDNFILGAARLLMTGGLLTPEQAPRFDVAILNPPYRKLRSESIERRTMNSVGIETSNLYSAFVWLALELLEDGGELVAITPRSFMNGSYFRPFRQTLATKLSFRRVHVYDARDAAFAGDAVLQENVIFHGVRGEAPEKVRISTSHGPADTAVTERTIDPSELIFPTDPSCVLHLAPDGIEAKISEQMRGLPHSLAGLGVSVSTGRVVGFRAQDRLRSEARAGDAPLIMPRHLTKGFVEWPKTTGSKPNALTVTGPRDDLLLPAGWYVLVHRFSAKEQKRRVVAALYDPRRVDAQGVAFDNKLNVLHRANGGLPEVLAKGLAVFLNSTAIDSYFRQFSGHTQVNAGDLRSMRFPATQDLERVGRGVNHCMPGQEEIDQLVGKEIPRMVDVEDFFTRNRWIEEGESALRAVNAPEGQLNQRSALTLLALLKLEPGTPWSEANSPQLGVTEIMKWIGENYDKPYAPNSRETFRKNTIQPFIAMGLISANPDDKGRPTNSPNNVYQVAPAALEVFRRFGSEAWEGKVATYVTEVNNRLREKPREMAQIPVRLPNGHAVELSAGGQNELIKAIIEQFAPRFTPGGVVMYVGDAAEKYRHYEKEALQGLGIKIDPHGRMPDVVIHHKERNWLVVVEAVTSSNPVEKLRRNHLESVFADSTAGLVFVTAFLNRDAMRAFLTRIDWETEVWVADAGTHLIHFNGERFLGPYEDQHGT